MQFNSEVAQLGYPGATELRARAEAALKAAEPAAAPPPTPPIASRPPIQETPPPPDRSPVTPPKTPIGSSLLWMLLITFLGNALVFSVALALGRSNSAGEVDWGETLSSAAAVGVFLTVVWGVAYMIAALRKGQRIAPDRGSALRVAPFAPFKAGGIRTLAGLPVNAFIPSFPVVMAPDEEWSLYAWLGFWALFLLLYWSAIRNIERRVGNND